MTRRKRAHTDLYDSEGINTGNRRVGVDHEETGCFFDSLYEQEDYCPNCDYEGPLELKRKGYRCPECRSIVIPNE